MARDMLRTWLKLDRIHCHDEGDGWGSAEPYLWTVFFKIDGDTVALTESLTLSGTPTVVDTPGSHGNLGDTDVDAGDNVQIPAAIGEWSPFLTPIPVPESLRALVGDDLPGVLGVACILMEEDNVSDDGAAAGHEALNAAVASALADIIATRSFAKPDITEDEIDDYMQAISGAVSGAIRNHQNLLENLWSWLNRDDTIGTKVFFWKHDDLAAGDTITFSQRWHEDGDWELFGHVNASVVCTAEAAAAASAIINSIFAKISTQMRTFRDREVGGTGLQRWWSVAERNSPQLAHVLRQHPKATESVSALMQALPDLLKNRQTRLSKEHIAHARLVLQELQHTGSRRSRIDASRALDILPHLQGKTVHDAFELLRSVQPGRTPIPAKDIGPLLNPEAPTPRSLLRPLEPNA